MRLKLLFFPAALALSLFILLIYAWPEFENLRAGMKALDESRSVLATIVEKNKNIENMVNSLDEDSNKEKLVKSYLPDDKNQERIIHVLNFLADNSVVSLVNVAVEKDNSVVAPLPPAPAPEVSSSGQAVFGNTSAASPDATANMTSISTVNYSSVKADVVGKYENVKAFLEDIYKIQMYNSMESFSINKEITDESQPPVEGQPAPDPSILTATVKINFGYMSRVGVNSNNYEEPIFKQPEFKMAAYEKISGSTSIKIPDIKISSGGRGNPFLP